MGEQQFKCDLCPFESYYSNSLRLHVKKVHLKVLRENCGESGAPVVIVVDKYGLQGCQIEA